MTKKYSNVKLKPRNPVARSPLLRKGGAHVKSKSSIRAQARLNIQDELQDWHDEF